ncbi:hypothetical protein AKJ16_DCAP25040 [Drosera capensis]
MLLSFSLFCPLQLSKPLIESHVSAHPVHGKITSGGNLSSCWSLTSAYEVPCIVASSGFGGLEIWKLTEFLYTAVY